MLASQLIESLHDPLGIASYLVAASTGICYYGVAFYAYLLAMKHMKAGQAGMYLNLAPAFTIGLAWALLDETFAPLQWTGAVVVFSAVVAITRMMQAEMQ